jgi:hypothetical protein
MEQRKKFYVALAIYAVLGLLIWMTIDNIPLPVGAFIPLRLRGVLSEIGMIQVTVRQFALAILGIFVLRTVLHRYAVQIREERESKQASS